MLRGVTTRISRVGEACLRVTACTSWDQRSKERAVRYMAGFGAGVRYGVHCSNLENLARGIVERVFYVVRDGGLTRPPQPKAGVFNSRLATVRKRLFRYTNPTPIVSVEEYPTLYTGRKRGVYERARESLSMKAIHFRDAWVNVFVKAEKINLSNKEDPAPRVIQPRSPRYNLMVGRYLKKFEKSLCGGFRRMAGYCVILKGLNASGVGQQLAENWSLFREPVGVGLDASRFDQHVSAQALAWEHSVYNGVFNSTELRRLLRMQIDNHGIGRVGGYRVDYDVHGCRMSGDINTGMGNCLLMSSMTIAYCESVGVNHRLANNGDDCVLVVERSDLHKLDQIEEWFLDFGFTLVREAPVYQLEKVVFCQAQPVYTSTGWRMVRDPRIAMSKDCVSLLPWDSPEQLHVWADAIGQCGDQLTRGVPVWNAWYNRLLRHGKRGGAGAFESVMDSGLGYMSKGVVGGEVTPESRVSFYRAFGIMPDLQIALEDEYLGPSEITGCCPMTYPSVVSTDKQNSITQWLATQRTP